MLDKLSRKILKKMNSDKTPSEKIYSLGEGLEKMSGELKSDTGTVRAAIRFLEQNEYLKFARTSGGNTIGFYLDHKGLHWKEFRRGELRKYIRDKWIDFFALLVATSALVMSILSLLN